MKCFILQDGQPAAGCLPWSGPHVPSMSQHWGWGVWNALGKLEYLKVWSSCLGKGWEVFLFCLLWWQNKCIQESFSELMLRGFFMTSTMTRHKAKANWGGEIAFPGVRGQEGSDDFFCNLIKSVIVMELFRSLKISFQSEHLHVYITHIMMSWL